ncbi:MAG: ABC transporter substrate-binding protein [Holophaga sp.]|jgi:peptide/nickel transport system substrate-binding protein
MNKKATSTSLLIALGAACAWAATPPDTLVLGKSSDPQMLDTCVSEDNNDWTITYPAYQRLMKYKGSGTVVEPDLATGYSISKDNLIYTFHIKSGQKFDDGSTLDANAVKFTFDRLMKLKEGPADPFPADLTCTVLNPTTVEFHMGKVCPYFVYVLANNCGGIINPKVMEHEVNGDNAKAWLAGHTAGSGPFRLAEWLKSQSLTLDQNPYYAGKKPVLKKMVVRIIGEAASRRLQLESGDLDIVETLPVDQFAEVAKKPNLVVTQNPSLLCTYLYMNNSRPPLNNPEVRQAISYAADYTGIIKSIMKGQAKQMRGPIPEGMWAHDPSAFMFSNDMAKAKALLAKNHISNLTLGFLYSNRDPNWEPIALSTQAQLAQLGITVKLESMANATMRERLNKGDFDLSIGNWSPDFADPSQFMNAWFQEDRKGLAGNRSFYDNPTVNKMVLDAASTTDQKMRVKLYQDAQKIAINDAAYVYLYQKNSQVALSKAVKGFVFNPMLEQIFNIDTITKQ